MNAGRENQHQSAPQAAVGFSIAYDLSDDAIERWRREHRKIKSLFPWLESMEFVLGSTRLSVWSHRHPDKSILVTHAGETILLVGEPLKSYSWTCALSELRSSRYEEFVLPWEGRCILLLVTPGGDEWHAWEDWAGSIPVFYTEAHEQIASTLEPVVVEVASLTSADFSRRGLAELMTLGHFLDTDTLYEPVKVLPPDSYAVWRHGKRRSLKRLWTVQPSDTNYGAHESTLVDRMYELAVNAISESLTCEDCSVILPLSSGMDSRLIACVASDIGVDIEARTYGPREWAEVKFAHEVAEALGIPWKRIDLNTDYTADFIKPWLYWFGCSLHAHGMYQFPFLKEVENKLPMIPNGFLGGMVAGGDLLYNRPFDTDKGFFEWFHGLFPYWDKDSLAELLDFEPGPLFLEMEGVLEEQISIMPDWPEHQKMNTLNSWNREARFISYQPTMYSYFGFERSPFMHRDYARFCLSLSDDLLKERKLQIEMLEKHWPHIARIKGTFLPRRGLDRKWHGGRSILAERLPKKLRPLMGATSVNKADIDCAVSRKWDAVFPLSPSLSDIGPLRARPIKAAAMRAIAGSKNDLLKVMAVQPVVYRLQNLE